MPRADFYLIDKPRFREQPLLLVCELAKRGFAANLPILVLARDAARKTTAAPTRAGATPPKGRLLTQQGGQHHRQTLGMIQPVQGGELVTYGMGGPVLGHAAPDEAVEGQAGGPHQVRAEITKPGVNRALLFEYGWGARIRTWVWRNQNPLPYRLATPQFFKRTILLL